MSARPRAAAAKRASRASMAAKARASMAGAAVIPLNLPNAGAGIPLNLPNAGSGLAAGYGAGAYPYVLPARLDMYGIPMSDLDLVEGSGPFLDKIKGALTNVLGNVKKAVLDQSVLPTAKAVGRILRDTGIPGSKLVATSIEQLTPLVQSIVKRLPGGGVYLAGGSWGGAVMIAPQRV